MTPEEAANKLILKVIEKVKLNENPPDAGSETKGYFDDIIKEFKDYKIKDISESILNIVLAILDKPEVKLIHNPGYEVVHIYDELR